MKRYKKKDWRLDRRAKYRFRKPWVRFVEWARRRCGDTKSKWYEYYGAKGIDCTLNASQAEMLWLRDRAEQLRRPSLDRIDPSRGYHLENCRFLEFNLNSRIAWDPKARPPRDEPSD
jgi:hypothetical protein